MQLTHALRERVTLFLDGSARRGIVAQRGLDGGEFGAVEFAQGVGGQTGIIG